MYLSRLGLALLSCSIGCSDITHGSHDTPEENADSGQGVDDGQREVTPFASMSIGLSFKDLVAQSDVIVVARAVQRESTWENARIITVTRLQTHECWVGWVGHDFRIKTLGGAIGNIGQNAEGQPSLPIGHTFVLYLRRGADGTYCPTGLEQGVLEILDEGKPNPNGLGQSWLADLKNQVMATPHK